MEATGSRKGLADQYKTHETPDDRVRQEEIIVRLCGAKGLTYKLRPRMDVADADLYLNNELLCVAEVKHRNNVFRKYSDYTIDQAKIDALLNEAWNWGAQPILIVQWTDGIRYCWPKKGILNYAKGIQKRKDRDESPDPVYHIPLDDFRAI